MTTYMVLERGEQEGDWEEVGEFEAHGDKNAIAQAANGRETPTTMVAVPMRSFKIRPVSYQRRISFVDGKDAPDTPHVEEPRPEPAEEPAL